MIYSKKPFVPRGPLLPSVHRQAHCPANSLHLRSKNVSYHTALPQQLQIHLKFTSLTQVLLKAHSNNTTCKYTLPPDWQYHINVEYVDIHWSSVLCRKAIKYGMSELTIIRFPPTVVCAFLSASPFICVYVVSLSLCYSNFLFEFVNQFPCVCVFISILFFLVRRQQICFSASSHACHFVSLCTSQKFFLSFSFLYHIIQLKTSSRLFTWELI